VEFAQSKAQRDYIGETELLMRELTVICGSKDSANELLGKMTDHYEKTTRDLSAIEKKYPEKGGNFLREKSALLSVKKYELEKLIEHYAPAAADRTKDLIIAGSLAVIAITLPLTVAASVLATATSIIAIGGSYFASYHILKSWPVISSKARVHAFFERGAIPKRASSVKAKKVGKKR
jgi:hypothetical protein